MVDQKITELADLPTPAGADLFAMVDDVVGIATTKKATLTNVEAVIDHNNLTNTHNLTTDIDHNTITNTHNLTTDISHDSITAGTIADHDTTATGAQLTTLTDNSVANTLHRHSELVASDGAPDPALSVNAAGNVGIGTTSPRARVEIVDNGAATNIIPGLSIRLDDEIPIGLVIGNDALDPLAYRGLKFSVGADSKSRIETYINATHQDLLINPLGGNVGIGTTAPSELLDINSDAIRIRTAQTPASATATGDAGMICWDANYIYVCVATNTWKRVAIATW